MPLTVGGGVRTLQDVRDLLNAGADKVSIMTAAVENPDLVAREAAVKIGTANLVVAIDAKRGAREPGAEGRAGRSSPTAAASRPASTPSTGRGGWQRPAPARSC